MGIRKLRQILKSLADDTRLRIINLLSEKELTVTELCKILGKNQSNISKHLTRLRLTGLVGDKRLGLNVYYFLIKGKERTYRKLIDCLTIELDKIKTFKQDYKRLKKAQKAKMKD